MSNRLFEGYPLRWVALAAALAGIAITLALGLDPMRNPDSVAFLALADSLVQGAGLRYREALIPGLHLLAFRAPGYPLFMAPLVASAGPAGIVVVQGALCGLSAALVGDIARRLGGGPRAAWIAFAIRMAWPSAWFHAALLLSEVLYEFLTVLATWLVLEAIERRRATWTLPAAAATAWAVLCRPVGLGLAFALGVWLLLRFRRAAFVFAAATVLLWLPWPLRNARELHAFVPFTTNGGATAWAGTTDGNVRPAYEWMGANARLGEVGFDRHFRELAERNIRAHPGANAVAALRRAFVYLGPIRGRQADLGLPRFAMLAALAGLVLAESRRRLALPLLNWAAQGAIMVPVLLIDRYRFPTDWCVVLGAALGIEALGGRIGAGRAAIAVGLALAACLAGSWLLSLGVRAG